MELNVVELVVQAGSLGLVVLILLGLWKFGGAMVTRLMDNLDQQARNNEASIHAQEQLTAVMRTLCERMDEAEDRDKGRDEETARFRTETVNALKELSGAIRGLQQQQQAHEGRAQKRYEQTLAHADERHVETIAALQKLNGKG